MFRLHYECAFERFLARHQAPYLAVNQARRPIVEDVSLKNFDFLVRAASGRTYLIDVKGKRFPYRYGRRRIYWENWIARDDLDGLAAWEDALDGAEGLLVFAYHLTDPWEAGRFADTFAWRQRHYAFVAVRLSDFQRHGVVRSAHWQARNIPRELFRSLARPAGEVLLDPGFAWSPAFEDALTV